jgi:hypothetical protein
MQAEAPSRNYAYSTIMKRRGKIYDALMRNGLYGQQLLPDEFTHLVRAMRGATRFNLELLRGTLMEFAGVELNAQTADRIAIKLSGAYDDLKKGKVVGAFKGIGDPEWAPVEIAELRYGQIKKHRLFYAMRLLVLAGTAVGVEIRQSFPSKFVVPVLSRSLGWSMQDLRPTHSEMVRMWFNARLLQKDGKLQIDEFKCSSTQQKHNKKLREERASPCIRQYRQQCKSCPIGYAECPRGTHRYTWLRKECKRCHNEAAIFDPGEPGETICLICRTKRARSYALRERSV